MSVSERDDVSARGRALVEPPRRRTVPDGLDLVPARRLVEGHLTLRFALEPGDRPLVQVGDAVARGSAIAVRLRDAAIRDGGRVARRSAGGASAARPGEPWPAVGAAAGGRHGEPDRIGEHLYELGGHWRVVTGDLADPLEAPVAGTVTEVRIGSSIHLETSALGLRAAEVLGGPVRGRLELVRPAGGELRASAIDVGLAGAILVVGARIAAEALTRARAMGVRGIVVGGLPSKERRDFVASEARQRAARQRLPPFAVLVLGGALRRPIASPVMEVLAAFEGREVAIVADPPALVIDDPSVNVALPPIDLVRVRNGPLLGAEGRWAGLAGLRRFPGGVDLEAGLIAIGSDAPVPVPLGDLERYV